MGLSSHLSWLTSYSRCVIGFARSNLIASYFMCFSSDASRTTHCRAHDDRLLQCDWAPLLPSIDRFSAVDGDDFQCADGAPSAQNEAKLKDTQSREERRKSNPINTMCDRRDRRNGAKLMIRIQVLVLAREWRFKSSHPHQRKQPDTEIRTPSLGGRLLFLCCTLCGTVVPLESHIGRSDVGPPAQGPSQ